MVRRIRLVLVAAIVAVFASLVAAPAAASGRTDLDRIHDRLLRHDPGAPLLIAAHRGQWRDAPENSLAAIRHAIADGAEIVEIDVRPTRDGHLVLMHDETVDRTTNGTGKVSELTLAQVKSLRLKKGLGGAQAPLTSHTVPTFEEAMLAVKDRAMVNLDKGWPVREQMYEVLRRTGTVDHGLFKGSPTVAEAAAFMEKDPEILYMHIINDGTAGVVGTFPGRQPVAYEVVFDDAADPQVQPGTLAKIREDSRIWINTMWKNLAIDYTDEASLRDERLGWHTVVRSYGASMIQTDNVEALDYWRDGGDLDRYGKLPGNRSIRVEAEDFAPGGEGVGYHDLDPNRCTVARLDEGVDICDLEGAIAVNWIRAGEWLKYSVTVEKAGVYDVSARVSSPYSPAGTITLDWGHTESGPFSIGNTTHHEAFEVQPLERRYLGKGEHEFVVRMDENAYQNFNLDYLQFDHIGR
ncbi:glycerophosphodiester phosphodiesterase [Prauserella sp. PE36]|uniref:glycerophosphodiester phosphodiesterase family protein n=1 Tax=Prauserella sp. PE36 TaxID=1504709 RepID=UPI000DE4600D|nr:glycerophosphodiester phosphodiesterase family protein [Prauserella sp. PE36]RBM20963.1 glycerophosphodiester phosphodiesterase [Prauserella sp. PE36]